jgi:UDP-N-acetylmuramate--alanine ligase
MLIWVFQQLGVPVSWSVGAKIPFGEMGHYQEGSQYFIYEADEYARNFLSYHPAISVITGIDYDHPDIYPTRDVYNAAFKDFIGQSSQLIIWENDAKTLMLLPSGSHMLLNPDEPAIDQYLRLPGKVNRRNAWQALQAAGLATGADINRVVPILNAFPGVSRRFEQIAPLLYSDYAHTPPKIRGAIGIAQEIDRNNIVIVYEGLHNTRQHFIKDELKDLFNDAKHLYIVPSYLAREDPDLELLTPDKLRLLLNEDTQAKTTPSELDDKLKQAIQKHLDANDLVLCLTAGGGHSLDEWLRQNFHF